LLIHWQWLNNPTWHVQGAFIMLGQKNLLLFDGLQSTSKNLIVRKMTDIVVATIAKNEGREVLSRIRRL
jgi:hypothetical protein